MKRITLLLFTILSFGLSMSAQDPEKVPPLFDTEVVRKVSTLNIEGKIYEDVEVTMKSISPDYFISDHYKVKVQVKDSTGKKVWSKNFKNDYLYVFSSGQILIGKPHFNKMVIFNPVSTIWMGVVREKEGLYEMGY